MARVTVIGKIITQPKKTKQKVLEYTIQELQTKNRYIIQAANQIRQIEKGYTVNIIEGELTTKNNKTIIKCNNAHILSRNITDINRYKITVIKERNKKIITIHGRPWAKIQVNDGTEKLTTHKYENIKINFDKEQDELIKSIIKQKNTQHETPIFETMKNDIENEITLYINDILWGYIIQNEDKETYTITNHEKNKVKEKFKTQKEAITEAREIFIAEYNKLTKTTEKDDKKKQLNQQKFASKSKTKK